MPLPPHDAHPLPSRRALREAERAAASAASRVPGARSSLASVVLPVVPPAAAAPSAPSALPALPPLPAPARPRSRPRVVDLRDVDMRDVDMRDVDMRDVDMRDVDMRDVDMRDVDMRDVDMRDVDLREVDLRDLDRRETRSGGARGSEDDVHAHLVAAPRGVRAARTDAGPSRVPGPVAPALSEHVLEGGDDAWLAGVVPRPTPVASRAVVEDVAPAPATRDRASAWRRLPQLLVVTALVAGTVAYARAEDTAATAGEVVAYERAEQTVEPGAPTAALAPEGDVSGLVAGEDGLLRVSAEASRGGGRTVLPGCDGVPPETAQENGRIDETYLCALWDGTTEIRADAAVSLTLLNEQYRARFGTDMCLTDGYRSYAAQVSVRNRKPGLAARPGTSEHGFGLAVDLCGGVEGQGEGYWWLRENAAAFGWENPRWAQSGGGGPFEPWHWEYVAGQW